MTVLLLAALFVFPVSPAQDTAVAAAPLPADAYADSAARELVARARAARDRNERLVTSYTATAKQRIGVGIRALSRDRMLYRQEMVARIAWKRDAPSTIEIVGAREGIPVAIRGDRVPEELRDVARGLVLNPAEDYLRVVGAQDDDGFVYPLREGGEADYRYAVGDSTVITLPSGRRIRLLALEAKPRRSDWRLIAGTFWFDADTYGLVRAVFRPARPYEFRRDAEPEDREDVPGWVNPTAEVRFVTIEYGLYEERWWMPRYVAIDAAGSMGSWLGVPVRLERVYEDYEVEGGTPPPAGTRFRPAGTVRRDPAVAGLDSAGRQRRADSVKAVLDECIDRAVAETRGNREGRTTRAAIADCRERDADSSLTVIVPPDTAALLTNAELGPPILDLGDLITEAEIRSLGDALGELPGRPWDPRLVLPRGAGSLLQHARYNRVEALSVGTAGALELGPLTIRGSARIGVADRVPNAELAVIRATPRSRVSLGGYRRLAAANPDVRPFGVVNSVLGVLAQRDDGQYYRALGVELVGQSATSGWWSGRIYVQRERAAAVETNASLPRVFDASRAFQPNIVADPATQWGATFTLRGTRTVSRTLLVGGETTVDGAVGDFRFARAAGTVRVLVTPAGPLAGALSVSAGSSVGVVPVQSRFYLGGPQSLRGYAGGVIAGSAFWAGRLEVGNSFPGARLTAFGDLGWAGDRAQWTSGRPLAGAGVGASFLDGLVRVDLARALRTPTGWRLDLYFDGVL